MLVTVTDFGADGPYLAQLHAAALARAPGLPILDLFTAAPAFNPRATAHLLAAYVPDMPPASVIVGVVDPGVGSAREAVAVQAGGRWFVGPDNGLFAVVAARADGAAAWRLAWPEPAASATFHGRDIFAPAAAALARGERPLGAALDAGRDLVGAAGPDELHEIIHIDGYGNAMTGLRAAEHPADAELRVNGRALPRRRTFSDVPPGAPLCYENANGLLEIAVNAGRADADLGLAIGTPVQIGG